MKLGRTPSIVLTFACGALSPLIVAVLFLFIPPSWTETTIGFTIVLFILYFVVVVLFTFLCYRVTQTFGLHQVLIFAITAIIVTRGKQLLMSSSELKGIIEAGTLFGTCLLVFFITLLVQRRKQK